MGKNTMNQSSDKKVLRRKISGGIAAVLLLIMMAAVVVVQGSTADIKEREKLGPFVHYNGIIFDTLETQSADIEGAAAVGGKAKLGTGWGQFDFGATAHGGYDHVAMGNYQNPNNYPTLLMNAVPQVGTSSANNVHAYGGPVVINETLKSAYASGNMVKATTKYAESGIVNDFFREAYAETERVGELFVNGNVNDKAAVDFSAVNKNWASFNAKQYYNNGDYSVYRPDNISDYGSYENVEPSRIAVINMKAGARISIEGMQIPKDMGAQFDLIVFNFPETFDVTFSGNSLMMDGTGFLTSDPRNKTVAEYAGKIIWNFPKAETVLTQWCGVVGSVLAPDADVNANGGSINGMLVSNSLKTVNGFELHAFYMRKNVFEFGKKDGTGSVELTKKDGGDGLLEGAVFELYKSDNTLLGTYTTDRYGKLRVDRLAFGDYYFIETIPPEGYEWDKDKSGNLIKKFTFTISENDEVIEIAAVNIEKTTDLILTKIDADNQKVLAGAKFALYRSHKTTSGKLNMELVKSDLETDDDGLLKIKDLTASYYYLVEYQAPDGYQLDKHNIYQFLVELNDVGDPEVGADSFYKLNVDIGDMDLNDPGAVDNDDTIAKEKLDVTESNVTITNHQIPEVTGGFSLLKRDGDTQEILAGAKFALYRKVGSGADDWQQIGSYTTNVFGRIDVDDLEEGTYKIEEVKAPDGYQLGGFREIFVISEENNKLYHEFAIVNTPLKANLEFIKVDVESDNGIKKTLSGAKFTLFRSTKTDEGTLNLSQVDTLSSDVNGVVKLTNLYAGHYYLVETAAPDGYQLPGDTAYQIILTINKDGSGLDEKVNKLTFDDPDKFDLSNPGDIANDPEGVTVEELTKDNRYIENEQLVRGRVTIQKVDQETQVPLPGAEFELASKDGGATYALVTNQLGYAAVDNLPLGEYTIRETKAPAGYTNTANITYKDQNHIDVNYDGGAFRLTKEDAAFTFVVKNKQIETSETLIKVDEKDTNNALPGAKFNLYRSEQKEDGGLYLKKEKAVTSNSNGEVELTGLKKGYYYLIETQAPIGFELLRDQAIQIEVKLNGNGTELVTTVYQLMLKEGATIADLETSGSENVTKTLLSDKCIPNKRTEPNEPAPKKELIIRKTDAADGALLEGAEFTLQKKMESGNWTDVVTGKATNAIGEIHFTDLEPGIYRVIETKAPDGYAITQAVYPDENGIELEADGKNVYEIGAKNERVTIAKASMNLTKIDGLTEEPLPGAEFLVYESLGISALPGAKQEDNSVVLMFKEVAVSDENGVIKIDDVLERHYYVAEVEAPISYAPVVEVIQADVQTIKDKVVVQKEIFSLEVNPRDIDLADITTVEDGTWENKKPISEGNIMNYQIVGSIALWKYVNGANELLPGAEFKLSLKTGDGENDWKEVGVYQTNASGYLHIPGLELGTYKLEETDWSGGYYNEWSSVDIILGIDQPDVTVVANNKKPVMDVAFKKQGEDNKGLADAKFNLYKAGQRENGTLLDFELIDDSIVSGSGGTFELKDLAKGSYYLVETETSEGYWLENTYKVYQIKVIWNETKKKLESTVKEVLILDPDAYDLNNPTGIANDHNLELVEVKSDNGTYIITNEKQPVFFGRAILMKRDSDGDTPLAGAKFRLSRREEDGTWKNLGVRTTNAFGQIAVERLKEGQYKVEEIEAPDGYKNSGFVKEFVIQEDTQGELKGPEVYVEIENEEIPGNITVEKQSYETGVPLAGVEFTLYYWQFEPSDAQAMPLPLSDAAEGAVGNMMFAAVPHEIDAKATGKDGKAVFQNLTQGWYTLVETGQLAGYKSAYTRYYKGSEEELNTDGVEISFEITGTGESYEHQFIAKNEPLKGDVTIIKADADSLYTDAENQNAEPITLPNVTFDLYRLTAGREEELVESKLKTDGGGRLVITNLPVGRYILYETDNPNAGYEVDDSNYIMFSIRANEDSTETIELGDIYFANEKDEAEVNLNIVKVRKDREHEVLEGAIFHLYRITEENGNKIETLVQNGIRTKEDGTAKVEGITVGDYILREMQAPTGFLTEQDGKKYEITFSVINEKNALKITSEAPELSFDKGGEAWLTISNTYVDYLPDIQLVKRDRDDESPLQGAKFAIYYAGTELDKAEIEHVKKYNLYSYVQSDSTGELVFPEMKAGYYYMAEEEAPEGYVLDTDTGSGTGLYFFQVAYDKDGKVTLDLNNRIYQEGEDNEEIKIYNQKEKPGEPDPDPTPKPKPRPGDDDENTDDGDNKKTDGGQGTKPKTGDFGSGLYLWIALGAGALLLLVILLKRKKTREKESKE